MQLKSNKNRLFISFVVLACSVVSAQTVEVMPSAIEQVEVIGPNAPEFNELVAANINDAGLIEAIQPALDLAVVVRNRGSRPIRSLVIRMERVNNAGGINFDTHHMTRQLLQGESMLVFARGSVEAYRNESTRSELLNGLGMLASRLRSISLDGAVLQDGEFLGPNHAQYYEYLVREGVEKRRLVRDLREREDLSDARLAEYIQQRLKEDPIEVGGRQVIAGIAELQFLAAALGSSRERFDDTLTTFENQLVAAEVWKR